jgi:hypothetical protein
MLISRLHQANGELWFVSAEDGKVRNNFTLSP